MPHVKVTDLLMEVDRWTSFTRHFVHLKTNKTAKDPALLLTAILADATNLGLGKMAESCPGTSLAKLSWLVAWYIRDETYSKALAQIVNHHHRVPFAAHGGEGTTSSSDGQRYRVGGRGEAVGQVNLKYGNDPGVTFYTHVSDQYSPFHTKVINAAVRAAIPPQAKNTAVSRMVKRAFACSVNTFSPFTLSMTKAGAAARFLAAKKTVPVFAGKWPQERMTYCESVMESTESAMGPRYFWASSVTSGRSGPCRQRASWKTPCLP